MQIIYMSASRRSRICLFLLLLPARSSCGQSIGSKRPFTPADDVELTTFQRGFERSDLVEFSPDGRYFSVITERGLLAANAPEDTIWIFQTEQARSFLDRPDKAAPSPLPLVKMATEKNGPIIERVRWLDDSSGVAFLAVRTTTRYRFHQLFVADIATRSISALTPEDQDVHEFNVQGSNYVYEVKAPEIIANDATIEQQTPKPLTGLDLGGIFFPPVPRLIPFNDAGLWAVVGGTKFQVKDRKTGKTFTDTSALALSPDAKSVVTILNTEGAPATWRRYKPPVGRENHRYPLDLGAYYLIDLHSGSTTPLVDAPTGRNQHHWNGQSFNARWSRDSTLVLLPNTFLPLDAATAEENALRESRPCTAVVRLPNREINCVLPVKAGLAKDRYEVSDLRFEDDDTVVIDFNRSRFLHDLPASELFRQTSDNSWKEIPGAVDPRISIRQTTVKVQQDVNHPPVVVAEDDALHKSRIVWDPNPGLRDIEIGQADVVYWKDGSGYEWEAGLVKPPDFVPGRRYPLVIQTHGFDKYRFLSNGSFSTAFAARALAAAGIVVLQMSENDTHKTSPKEGMDQIAGFESAVQKLANEGLVDSTKVGIIGFSRTVYHVLEALTKSKLHFAAASVSDGVTFGYFEYALVIELEPLLRETGQIYGEGPFTNLGLKHWIAEAPTFNMNKVKTPLLFLQPGKSAVMGDWEPYAALRSLKKPVDLIMLPSGTHVMTNPRQRLASETINVDWFRFWLNGEEDKDPAKAEQYARWRGLKKLENRDGEANP